jgi:hypothetical protein
MAVLLSMSLAPRAGWSWGWTGHRVAARMAELRLDPVALAAVRAILDPGESLSGVSTWADRQNEIPEGYRWHFVNIPLTQARYDPRYCLSDGCVVSKIEEFERILRDPRADKHRKQIALKFIIHFIADLHQPLHVGDNGDRGGNLLQVRFFGEGTSLHRVWDSQVIDRHTKNENVWQWDFDFLANPQKVSEWSKGTPEDWATESLQLAKEAYHQPGSERSLRSGSRLGNDYYRFALTAIQIQLAKAGIRTVYLLNRIFDTRHPSP